MPTSRKFALFALMLSACMLPGCTVEQILIGQWYAIRTPPSGGCPALTWHFVVNAQREIGGTLSGDRQSPVATLSGLLNPDDSFEITARASSGNRTATVTGQFTSGVSTISIHGDAAGTACDGQTFQLRLSGYFAHVGGGGGGGG